jgi:hypothetical protein
MPPKPRVFDVAKWVAWFGEGYTPAQIASMEGEVSATTVRARLKTAGTQVRRGVSPVSRGRGRNKVDVPKGGTVRLALNGKRGAGLYVLLDAADLPLVRRHGEFARLNFPEFKIARDAIGEVTR